MENERIQVVEIQVYVNENWVTTIRFTGIGYDGDCNATEWHDGNTQLGAIRAVLEDGCGFLEHVETLNAR